MLRILIIMGDELTLKLRNPLRRSLLSLLTLRGVAGHDEKTSCCLLQSPTLLNHCGLKLPSVSILTPCLYNSPLC